MVLAGSKKINTIIPLQAEAEALLWAVQLAMENEFPKAVLEGDSKTCLMLSPCGLEIDLGGSRTT